MGKFIALAILIMIILSACSSPAPAPTAISEPTIAPTETTVPARSAEPAQALLRSRHSEVAVQLDFVNKSAQASDYYWVDFDGKEQKYGTIEASASVVQDTYFTHPWIVRGQFGHIVLIYIPTETAKQTITISVDAVALAQKYALTSYPQLKSLHFDTEIMINFENGSSVPLDYYWVDYDGREQKYGTIEAGATIIQPTYFTHPWIGRDQSGNIVLIYIPTDAPQQTVTISADAVAFGQTP